VQNVYPVKPPMGGRQLAAAGSQAAPAAAGAGRPVRQVAMTNSGWWWRRFASTTTPSGHTAGLVAHMSAMPRVGLHRQDSEAAADQGGDPTAI